MYCKNCGKQIGKNDQFCPYCGDRQFPSLPPEESQCFKEDNYAMSSPRQVVCPQAFTSPKPSLAQTTKEDTPTLTSFIPHEEKDESAESSAVLTTPKTNSLKIWAIGLIVSALFLACFIGISSMLVNKEKPAPQTTTQKQMIKILYPTAHEIAKSQLSNPASSVFDTSNATVDYDGMSIYFNGEVQYTNAYKNKVKSTYRAGFIWSESGYVPMYLKLGENVLLYNLNSVNSEGVCIANRFTIGGNSFSRGQSVLENAVSGPSLFEKLDEDLFLFCIRSDNRKVLSLRYDQVQEGMSYGEVCYYLGSEGKLINTENEGTSTIRTYTWPFKGLSRKNTLAKMVFKDGVLTQKSTIWQKG